MKKNILVLIFVLFSYFQSFGQAANFDRNFTLGLYTAGYYVNASVSGYYYSFGLQTILNSTFPNGEINGFAIKIDLNGDTLKFNSVGTTMFTELFKYAVKADDSSFIAIGVVNDTTLSTYDYDLYLVKFNLNLDTLWTKTISHNGTEALKVHSIIKTADGNFIIGGYQNDWNNSYFTSFLMKVDLQGNQIWYKNYLTPGDHTIWGVAEADNGDLYCSGTDYNGSSLANVLIIKTDSLGSNYQVLQNLSSVGQSYGAQIQKTTNGNFIVAGNYNGCNSCPYFSRNILIDALGNILFDKRSSQSFVTEFFKTIPLSDNTFISVGDIQRTGQSRRGLLLKSDVNGDSVWSREFFVNGSYEMFWDIDTTSDGGYVMTGETYCCNFTPGQGYTSSLWLVKTDSLGLLITGINDAPNFNAVKFGLPYPNPSANNFTITALVPSYTNNALKGKNGAYLLLFDMQGKQLEELPLTLGLNTVNVDVSQYPNGNYLCVLVIDGYNVATKKVVVGR